MNAIQQKVDCVLWRMIGCQIIARRVPVRVVGSPAATWPALAAWKPELELLAAQIPQGRLDVVYQSAQRYFTGVVSDRVLPGLPIQNTYSVKHDLPMQGSSYQTLSSDALHWCALCGV